jgi:replication initiation and membrane attachment protein DnaB
MRQTQGKITYQYEQIRQDLWKTVGCFLLKNFGNTKSVVEYLGRYTIKSPLATTEFKSIDAQNVTLITKITEWQVQKKMTLTHQEFIRRFALHILPKRFVKIRHYGFEQYLETAKKSFETQSKVLEK